MTSTNFNVGLNTDSRMTSRVLKPPGGGHTDIFGASEPEPPRARRHQASTIVLGTENSNEEKATNGTSARAPPPTDNNENKTMPPAGFTSEKVDNQIQQESKPEPQKVEAPRAEPPKRVRVPPGGFSSGLW